MEVAPQRAQSLASAKPILGHSFTLHKPLICEVAALVFVILTLAWPLDLIWELFRELSIQHSQTMAGEVCLLSSICAALSKLLLLQHFTCATTSLWVSNVSSISLTCGIMTLTAAVVMLEIYSAMLTRGVSDIQGATLAQGVIS